MSHLPRPFMAFLKASASLSALKFSAGLIVGSSYNTEVKDLQVYLTILQFAWRINFKTRYRCYATFWVKVLHVHMSKVWLNFKPLILPGIMYFTRILICYHIKHLNPIFSHSEKIYTSDICLATIACNLRMRVKWFTLINYIELSLYLKKKDLIDVNVNISVSDDWVLPAQLPIPF